MQFKAWIFYMNMPLYISVRCKPKKLFDIYTEYEYY